MRRRTFLKTAATVALGPIALAAKNPPWERLREAIGARFAPVETPIGNPEFLANLKNPFYIGDQPALTQTTGWVDAWMSKQSDFVVNAESAEDIAAAVKFAREYKVRLAIKGGGHSYKGTSNAANSLLIWTRKMREVQIRESFAPAGAPLNHKGEPAVTLGAGCIWMDAYHAVTTQAGRYVQGGGCTTVGVAGLVQSGGFGSFSKKFGTASANLLEAEVVTAKGEILVANRFQNSDLFWALKGGGGGSLAVVTKLALRTHPLPEFFGAVFGRIKASSDKAYEALVAQVVSFYAKTLFNPHWGEQLKFRRDNFVEISMVFQGLTREQALDAWEPLVSWINDRKTDYVWEREFGVAAIPARHFWDASWWRKNIPQAIISDRRPNAREQDFFWEGDQGQVAFFLHGYISGWLPKRRLEEREQARFVKALVASSRIWTVSLHFNKGLAGGAPEAIEATRDTAMNPKVLDAFALAIIAGASDPAYPAIGRAPDHRKAREDAASIKKSANELFKVAPAPGAYVSESDFFERNYRESFWGSNAKRLARVKKNCDPTGLFSVHHGIS